MRQAMRRMLFASHGFRKAESSTYQSPPVHYNLKLNETKTTIRTESCRLFNVNELIILDLLPKLEAASPSDNEKIIQDFFQILIAEPAFDPSYEKHLEQALKFLYKRHPTLRAYFARDEEGPKRVYAEEPEKIPFEKHMLQCTLSSPDLRAFLHTKIDGMENQKKVLDKVPSRWYFIQTLDSKVLFYYSHHGFIDTESIRMLGNELHHFCRKLAENKETTYEEATKDLAKIASYEEVVRKACETQDSKKEALFNDLKPVFESLNLDKLGVLWAAPSEKPEISRPIIVHRLYSDASVKFIKANKLDTNKVVRTIFQLALHNVFKVDSPIIPFAKLNGRRPDYAKGVSCCWVNGHLLYQDVNPGNTFLEQYAANSRHNKEILTKFGDIDAKKTLDTLTEVLGKDCFPKICYHFLPINPRESKWIESFWLLDEYDTYGFNLYFELLDDQKRERYEFMLVYDKTIFDSLTMTRLMTYIMTALDNLEGLLQTKVGDMTEEKVLGLFLKK